MKKNILLFSVLVCLLTFIYFFEEVGVNEKQLAEQNNLTTVDFNFESIQEVELSNAHLVRNGDRFTTKVGNYPVDESYLQHFLKQISYLKTERFLSFNEEMSVEKLREFIPEETIAINFKHKEGSLRYLLGKKINYSDTWYMLIERKSADSGTSEVQLLVVEDENPAPYYAGEENKDTSAAKYNRFKSTLLVKESFFYDRRIFFNDALKEITDLKNVKFENKRNRSFYVSFEKPETTPPVQKGLYYSEEFIKKFASDLVSLRAKEIITLDHSGDDDLEENVSTLFLNFKKHSLKLYRMYQGRKGYFIKTNISKTLFELEAKEVAFFFLNVQDFWNKVALPEESKVGLGNVEFTMSFPKDKDYQMYIPQAQQFEIEVQSTSLSESKKALVPNHEKFSDLFQWLTGVGPKGQADRVSFMSDERLEELKGYPSFDLTFAPFALRIVHRKSEIIVVQLKDNFGLHYLVGDDSPIGLRDNDYFFLQDN